MCINCAAAVRERVLEEELRTWIGRHNVSILEGPALFAAFCSGHLLQWAHPNVVCFYQQNPGSLDQRGVLGSSFEELAHCIGAICDWKGAPVVAFRV